MNSNSIPRYTISSSSNISICPSPPDLNISSSIHLTISSLPEESKLPSSPHKRPRLGDYSSSFKLFTDGASKNNPGEAGIGFALYDSDDSIILTGMQFIGIRTNNFAEYTALLQGLKTCLKYSYEYVDAYLDSELIVKQLKGEYRVKNPDLTPLYKEVESLKKEFRSFTVTHIPRSQNSKADSLANIAIKNCIRDLDVKFSKTLVNIL